MAKVIDAALGRESGQRLSKERAPNSFPESLEVRTAYQGKSTTVIIGPCGPGLVGGQVRCYGKVAQEARDFPGLLNERRKHD